MQNQSTDKLRLVRYLLGELSEDEQLALEERYFSDTALYERLQNVEEELIRQYVGNVLSSHERQLFEKRILTRPWQREKVKLAQALNVYLNRDQTQERATIATFHEKIVAWLRSFASKPAFAWSMAMVVMFFVGSCLFFQAKDLQTQIAQLEKDRLIFAQRGQNNTLTEQLRNEQNQRAKLERKQKPPNLSQPALSVIELSSGVSRSVSGSDQPRRFSLDPRQQMIKLQLDFGGAERYESCRAILATAAGDTIWGQYQLQIQQTPKGKAVILLLPSNVLSYDDYLITLHGVLPWREIVEIGHYYFSVRQ